MSHTIFIYASIVLVVLIILGVVFTIITMRRLHSTQKQLQKQDKASTKEKIRLVWALIISYSYKNYLLSKILKLRGIRLFQIKTCIKILL